MAHYEAGITSMLDAARAVASRPGYTAHRYSAIDGGRARYQWVYAAFRRAVRHGMIVPAPHPVRPNWTIYFPAGKAAEFQVAELPRRYLPLSADSSTTVSGLS